MPKYLLDNSDINKQIQKAISKNMTSDGGFEAIYNEFIRNQLFINTKIKNFALGAMAEFFDNVTKKDDKGNLINGVLLKKILLVMKKIY